MTSPALMEHSGGGLTTRRSIGRRRRRCRDSGRGGRRNYGRVRLIAGHRRRGRRRARSLRGFFLFAGHAFSSKQSARHETRTFENEHAGTAMHERSHCGARGKEGSDHSARRDQLAQCRVGMSACGNSTSVAHVRRRNHRGWSRPRQRTALGIVGGLARCAGISPKRDTLLVLHHFLAFALRPGVRGRSMAFALSPLAAFISRTWRGSCANEERPSRSSGSTPGLKWRNSVWPEEAAPAGAGSDRVAMTTDAGLAPRVPEVARGFS